MELNEAIEVLKNHDFIVEGAYKDVIHARLKGIRAEEKEVADEDDKKSALALKAVKKIYKELKEFCSDFNDEIVADKMKLGEIKSNSINGYDFEIRDSSDSDNNIRVRMYCWNLHGEYTIMAEAKRLMTGYMLDERKIPVKKFKEESPKFLEVIMDYITDYCN